MLWIAVAVFISLFFSRTAFGVSSFGTNRTNISLCSELSGNLSFLSVRTENEKSKNIKLDGSLVYNILTLFLECKGNDYLRTLKPNLYEDDLWQFENGSVQIIDGKLLSSQEYCFNLNGNESLDGFTDVMICEWYPETAKFTFYSIAMVVSFPFLAITFCVYAYFHELRSLHGKSVMFYVLGLMILYAGLITAQMGADFFDFFDRGDALCVFVAYMIYAGLLISFFWLNVMCIDIWLTFRSHVKNTDEENKRFLLFSIYAIGTPALIILIVYLVDSTDYNYRPQFGQEGCWIKDEKILEGIYIFLPISIISIVNIVLYSITACKIYRIKKETKVLRRGDSQKHSNLNCDKARFFLYLRLFIIMGAVWSVEPIYWFFGADSIVTNIFHYLNCLQGIIIFVLFIWTPKVRKLFDQRYRRFRNLPKQSTQSMRDNSTKVTIVVYNRD